MHVGWCYAVGYVRCQDELLACRHTCWGSRRRQCCGLAWVMENRVHHWILIWRYPGSVTDHYRWVVLLFGPLAPRRVGPLSSQAERPFAKGPSAAYSCRPSSEPELQHCTLRRGKTSRRLQYFSPKNLTWIAHRLFLNSTKDDRRLPVNDQQLALLPAPRQTTLNRQYLRKWCVTTPIPNFCEALGGNWAAGVLFLQLSRPPPPADRD